MRFEGFATCVATDDLKLTVNAALALERPLLIKGEQDVRLFGRVALMTRTDR